MDITWKKEARTAKDDIATDSNGRAEKQKGLSSGEAQASAKDRTLWKNIVVALCPTGDEEDKWGEVIYTYYMHVNQITVTTVMNYFSSKTDKSFGKDDIAVMHF